MSDTALDPIPLDLPFAWGGPAGSGRIRVQPEDFHVVEIPQVSPDGAGEHCWLRIRKRGTNTRWVARQLARHAGVPLSRVSYAGLKDRHAVTEQWFSVQLPGRPDPDWHALDDDGLQILEAHRHSRKLKRGTLVGNRFEIRIREVEAEPQTVEQRLQAIRAGGFPNVFGEQRFGHGGDNLLQAARLFANPRARVPRHKRGIWLSAVRSALFNRVLAERIQNDCWNTALPGEALQLDGRSACFVAERPGQELHQRLERLEVHPTGPLCGRGGQLAVGVAADRETRVLAPWAPWIDALKRLGLDAARRSLRAHPSELSWEHEQDGSWLLAFVLPAGSYATALLREVFQTGDNP